MAERAKKNIFVVGHKNPDTDSICSAIAYANLKNQLGGRTFEARRAGEISKETQFVLDYFQVEAPLMLENVGCVVEDAMLKQMPKTVLVDEPVKNLAQVISPRTSFVCVVDHENKLCGGVTINSLANRYVNELSQEGRGPLSIPLENACQILNAKVVNPVDGLKELSGNLIVGAMSPETMVKYVQPGDILITGDRENAQLEAVNAGVSCLVITGNAMPSDEVISAAKAKNVLLLVTEHGTYRTARLLNMSITVAEIMYKEPVVFRCHELLEDVKKIMLEKGFIMYPVVDDEGYLQGILSLRDILSATKRKVILVDHNERTQAVEGLNEAEILEIIDHHRLGNMPTDAPIYFRNEPVGCTSSIVAAIYEEKGVEITRTMAGLMLSAILSDTLVFRSPTCTPRDKEIGEKLAKIAGVNIDEYAKAMFKAGSDFDDKTPGEIVQQDFKEFVYGESKVGVGQVSALDLTALLEKTDELKSYMESLNEENGYVLSALMLTDILAESTELLFVGSEEIIKTAFAKEPHGNFVTLPGVVSRKKQIVPVLSNAFKD